MQRYYSNIYWHFTGSPDVDWNIVTMPAEIKGKAKSPEVSKNTLIKIILSQKLLAGVPEKIHGNVKTESFCCVCDIPFKDLISHAEYYGKVAIGFNSTAIQRSFNPVFYYKYNFPIPKKISADKNRKLDKNKAFDKNDSAFKLISYMFGLDESTEYNKFLDSELGLLKPYIKITRFSDKDEETFYREREWRKIGDFNFKPEDVEAILVPKGYFSEVKKTLKDNDYNSNISIVSYEFLEKA